MQKYPTSILSMTTAELRARARKMNCYRTARRRNSTLTVKACAYFTRDDFGSARVAKP